MPKMKTNKSVKKRIKVTGTGKLVRRRSRLRHLLSGRTAKQKRRLRRPASLKTGDKKRMRALLGI
ncbi:MAG TPA: 50S ribosomal protein L35 [Planctomycetota bacterium]|jgi:large subunit ribosomal protein L35|nr:50S ribosomal protein L35 [Planctomycetota bacterium]OQC20350.1 MAG: 50S ribosomal protein L35 [Planctomycetes bacterium ADurb.Bin069]NMD34425.1 50S ribosomal protein L35 [Planctomycetota bacterium]HNR98665.1 50S ribosomal protein L35 [Planctomycetota bacterium]HNU25045.1 50S ribosomal protein L35 [Planctomycetota bacterium]